jgi:protein TonB
VAGPDVAHQSPPTASTASAPASSPFQVQVSPREQLPTLLYQVPPVYPLQARAAGLEGVVSLSIVVDKDGLVRDVHLVRGDPLLAPAAIEAVSRWRYKPAFLDGVPRATSRTVMVEFSLSADRH